MNIVHIWFQVIVCEDEYAYSTSRKGEATLKVQAPRDMLDNLNAGDLLRVTLGAALAEFDASGQEEEQA